MDAVGLRRVVARACEAVPGIPGVQTIPSSSTQMIRIVIFESSMLQAINRTYASENTCEGNSTVMLMASLRRPDESTLPGSQCFCPVLSWVTAFFRS